MKLFVKLMLALMVIAMLLPFTLLKDDAGKPLASFSDFSLPDFSRLALPQFSSGGSASVSLDNITGGEIQIYKWYDASGDVQFTSEPPAEGIEFTVKGFDPNSNVIQAVRMPVEENLAEEKGPVEKGDAAVDIGATYSREAIEKLFEDANNVGKLLQERLQQQESSLNQ